MQVQKKMSLCRPSSYLRNAREDIAAPRFIVQFRQMLGQGSIDLVRLGKLLHQITNISQRGYKY